MGVKYFLCLVLIFPSLVFADLGLPAISDQSVPFRVISEMKKGGLVELQEVLAGGDFQHMLPTNHLSNGVGSIEEVSITRRLLRENILSQKKQLFIDLEFYSVVNGVKSPQKEFMIMIWVEENQQWKMDFIFTSASELPLL